MTYSSASLYFDVTFYGVNDNGVIDYDNVLKIAKECRPKLIVAGASAYARTIDFKRFREIADEMGAYLMVDIAHIAGLVATGLHPSPIPYAHVTTTTTHKTLRGPRGGMILSSEDVGSGPAGLACASDLAKLGYDVTVFEALHRPGGVLEYGIPEFRLPKDKVVAAEIAQVKALGVKIETNVVVGRTVTIDSLLDEEGFEAVFVGSGAGLPKFMGIPGENLNGVFSANEFLTRNNLMKAYRDDYMTPIHTGSKVVVVGGGNVAMDAARTALRLGAHTTIVYRRTEKELPARLEEVHHAKEEGIEFAMLTNPVEVLGDEKGWVRAVKCIRMELGEPDESGRRSPVPVAGSEFEIETDTVIMSLGTSPNPLIAKTTGGLETNRRGCLVADESGVTTRQGVFAGGDAVTGAATVILAMGAGRKAAAAIHEYIGGKL